MTLLLKENRIMKKYLSKVFLGAMALTFGGATAAGIYANQINNQPTISTIESSNIITLNNRATLAKAEVADASSGFNLSKMITEGIQRGGINLLGMAGAALGNMAFKAILSNIGVDVRSAEQKSLDQIQAQLSDLKNYLKNGIVDVKRSIIQVQHKNLMNNILAELDNIQTPVASKIATMIDISKKELNPNYDAKELEKEKETFYKGLDDMKFANPSGVNLWNTVENLAKSILTPFNPEKSLKLNDLYEDCYGATETWDYMTIAPRTKFISYIASLVNSLAEIALVKANYEMSKLAPNDSNLLDYRTGLNSMASAVNALNAEFKEELEKLAAIQRKHDEEHLITHRDMVVNNDGSITYKDGKTLSTKLFALTSADNDDNYVSYYHNEQNRPISVDFGMGQKQTVYENYIYTLDCTANRNLYKTVTSEYNTYRNCLGAENKKNFTMQDYLYKAGFTCDNKEGFEKAKGFYERIEHVNRDYSGIWKKDYHNDIRAIYYNFKKTDGKVTVGEISDARELQNGWFASSKTWHEKGDQADNYYLVFVEPNQKTIGKIAITDIERTSSPTAKTTDYKNHFKGHKIWTAGENTEVNI